MRADVSCGSISTELGCPRHVRFAPDSDQTADIAGGLFVADIVAKVENRTTPKISPKLIFGLSAAGPLFSGTTEVRDRFWMKRYGPSRRRAENASVALRFFVRHPKKTVATRSTRCGHRP